MLPSNRAGHVGGAGARGAGFAVRLVMAFGSVSPALAHSLHISRGQAVVHEDHVAVEIEIAAEDFLHGPYVGIAGVGRFSRESLVEAAEAQASVLDCAFVIRDERGNHLQAGGLRPIVDWPPAATLDPGDVRNLVARYTATYNLAAPAEFLLFQLWVRDAPMVLPWQLVLNVQGASQAAGTVVRLTSRGNIEAVELSWNQGHPQVASRTGDGASCTPCEGRGPARFKEVCAEIEVAESHVDVQLFIPLPVLATWIGVGAADDEWLDAEEQAAASPSATTLVLGGLSVDTDAGPLAAALRNLSFTQPQPGSDDRVSFWTGSLRASLRFPSSGRIERATLRWALFNGAVLSARANIRSADVCTTHEFSAYRPEYVVPRREQAPP